MNYKQVDYVIYHLTIKEKLKMISEVTLNETIQIKFKLHNTSDMSYFKYIYIQQFKINFLLIKYHSDPSKFMSD